MKTIQNQTFDEERALYGSRDLQVKNCSFDGPADGESAFKECSGVEAEHCFFNLRYPFWHDHGLKISGSEMTALCRAALWYSDHVEITDTKLHGIKALRELQRYKDEKLRYHFPGVWLVYRKRGDGGYHSPERIFYDALKASVLPECGTEGKIFLPVH